MYLFIFIILTFLVYVAEIASKNHRGTLSNMINVIFCFGLVLTFFISSFVTWRVLAWILLAPMGMTALGMLIVPETPLWLAQKGRLKDSLEALAWLRCNEETEEEVKELKDRFDTETNSSVLTKIKTKIQIAQEGFKRVHFMSCYLAPFYRKYVT